MSNYKIDRRRFVSGTGLVLVLPFFESLIASYANAQVAAPKRAVWLYMPNGTYNRPDDSPWEPPTGLMTAATLPPVLSPFATRTGDFSVLKHLGNASRNTTDGNYYKFNGNGGGHVSAVSTFLSAQVITTPQSTACSIARPSIDQVIAQKTGKAALTLHSGGLGYGADSSPFDYSNYISFNAGKPVQPMTNPRDVYNRLFALVTPPPTVVRGPSSAVQKSILDVAVNDLNHLKNRLGKSDRSKLEDYLTSLRALETKITSAPPPASLCTSPSPPTINNFGGENITDYIPRVQAYFDMIAFAFLCDLSRSATFMFDGEVGERALRAQVPNNLIYNGAALDAGMHIGIAHNGGKDKNITKDRVYMSLMFHLVDRLKAITDPGGSPALDNTIIHLGYGVSSGEHGSGNAPAVLAGGRNMINPGYSYDLQGYDQKDLLFTIGSKLGVGITSFEGSVRLAPV